MQSPLWYHVDWWIGLCWNHVILHTYTKFKKPLPILIALIWTVMTDMTVLHYAYRSFTCVEVAQYEFTIMNRDRGLQLVIECT